VSHNQASSVFILTKLKGCFPSTSVIVTWLLPSLSSPFSFTHSFSYFQALSCGSCSPSPVLRAQLSLLHSSKPYPVAPVPLALSSGPSFPFSTPHSGKQRGSRSSEFLPLHFITVTAHHCSDNKVVRMASRNICKSGNSMVHGRNAVKGETSMTHRKSVMYIHHCSSQD